MRKPNIPSQKEYLVLNLKFLIFLLYLRGFICLFYKLDFFHFTSFRVEKSLIIHPLIIINLAHIARSMIRENNNHIAIFIKLAFFFHLDYTLHSSTACISNKQSFFFS